MELFSSGRIQVLKNSFRVCNYFVLFSFDSLAVSLLHFFCALANLLAYAFVGSFERTIFGS